MPTADLPKRTLVDAIQYPGFRLTTAGLVLLFLFQSQIANAQTCPALQSYYPANNPASPSEWSAKLAQLEPLLESCLTNAEYFALLGAAQMNSGQVPQALESLERALLIDPDMGAAQIDYAEGLYLAGQLFPALEINAALLQRQDLPGNLRPMIEARQQLWQQQTSNRQFLLEATTGYDSNLNGGPTQSDLSLTFGGTPVEFTLDPNYQPKNGAFANLRLGGAWQKLNASHQHDVLATVRLRKASENNTDIAQADWRYTFSLPTLHNRWELSAGSSHMVFGGSPLYSAGELRARFVVGSNQCRPGIEGGVQQLNYYDQSVMNGVESSLVASYSCSLSQNGQQLRLEAGVLRNHALQSTRPGRDRKGWNLRLNWQLQRGRSEYSSQLGLSRLEDQAGYSVLLNSGAVRNVTSGYVNLRYKYTIRPGLAAMANLSHQRQESNLETFQNRGTVVEVGLALDF
jgi:hypothetical protein